jgi:ABC-type Zn2+ transport system substrate-binding protein/surface adhesin
VRELDDARARLARHERGVRTAGAPRKAVEDHRAWEYFARRFGVEIVAALEPLPGIAPTTRHLAEVVARMRAESVGLVFATASFAPARARRSAARSRTARAPAAATARPTSTAPTWS